MDPFLTELNTIAPPADRGDRIFHDADGKVLGYVQLLHGWGRRIVIHRFWVRRPGQGAGRKMLTKLCELADRHGVELRLKALPIGRKPYPMSRDQLCAWYQRYGFVGTRRKLIRPPGKPVFVKSAKP